jgi:hypothetical protein
VLWIRFGGEFSLVFIWVWDLNGIWNCVWVKDLGRGKVGWHSWKGLWK